MLEFAPVELRQSLRDGTEALAFSAQGRDRLDEIHRFVKATDVLRNVGEGERAAVFPDDTDARIDLRDRVETVFDRGRVQTELQLESGVFFEKEGRRVIDEIDHCVRDRDPVHVVGVQLGRGLKIDPVCGNTAVFLLVLREDLRAVILQVQEIDLSAIGVPEPRKAPDDLHPAGVCVCDHFLGIYGNVVVPDRQRVHFQLYHVVDESAVIVDDVSPSPDAAVPDRRIGRVRKIGEELFKAVLPVDRFGAGVLVFYDILVVEIHAAVQHASIVVALDRDRFVFHRDRIFFLVGEARVGVLRNIGIAFLCADVNASVIGKLGRLSVTKANGITEGIVKQELTEECDRLLLDAVFEFAVNDRDFFHFAVPFRNLVVI